MALPAESSPDTQAEQQGTGYEQYERLSERDKAGYLRSLTAQERRTFQQGYRQWTDARRHLGAHRDLLAQGKAALARGDHEAATQHLLGAHQQFLALRPAPADCRNEAPFLLAENQLRQTLATAEEAGEQGVLASERAARALWSSLQSLAAAIAADQPVWEERFAPAVSGYLLAELAGGFAEARRGGSFEASRAWPHVARWLEARGRKHLAYHFKTHAGLPVVEADFNPFVKSLHPPPGATDVPLDAAIEVVTTLGFQDPRYWSLEVFPIGPTEAVEGRASAGLSGTREIGVETGSPVTPSTLRGLNVARFRPLNPLRPERRYEVRVGATNRVGSGYAFAHRWSFVTTAAAAEPSTSARAIETDAARATAGARELIEWRRSLDPARHAGVTALHRAAAEGDAEATARILTAARMEDAGGIGVIPGLLSARDGAGWHLVHHAAWAGRTRFLQMLPATVGTALGSPSAARATPWSGRPLRTGVEDPGNPQGPGSPASPADRMVTPLHLAIAAGHRELVNQLLAGLDPGSAAETVEARDRFGLRPLHYACVFGDAALVAGLLARGADRHAAVSSADALAGESGSRSVGLTPAHLAVQAGRLDSLQALEPAPADLAARDGRGASLLHHAAHQGSHAMFVWLLARGAEVAARDAAGRTILHVAAHAGHTDLVADLITRQADLRAIDGEQREPVHLAAAAAHFEVVRQLVEAGIDIEAQDGEGYRPLHFACAQEDPAVAGFLLARGARGQAQAKDGLAPLHLAARADATAPARLLLAHGAGVNVEVEDARGWRPLHVAAAADATAMVQLLIQEGFADCNAGTGSGASVLCVAVQERASRVIQHLLSPQFADVLAVNLTGNDQTPLDCALANCDLASADLLRRRGAKKHSDL